MQKYKQQRNKTMYKLNREFIGIELNEEYFKIAEKRIEKGEK